MTYTLHSIIEDQAAGYSFRVVPAVIETKRGTFDVFQVIETDHVRGTETTFPNDFGSRQEAEDAIADYLAA